MIETLFIQSCGLIYFKTVVLLRQLVHQGDLSIKQMIAPIDYVTKVFVSIPR